MMADTVSLPSWHLAALPTPLHRRTADLCRTNAWTTRNGFTLVDVYDVAAAEHAALRSACGISDRSHLVTYAIAGPEAAAFLDRLAGGCGGKLNPGGTRRAVICDDDGALIAEALVMRPAEGEWRLTLASPLRDWLDLSAQGFDVAIENISAATAVIGAEGPTSCAVLLSAGFGGLEALRPWQVRHLAVGGAEVLVSRNTSSGGLGYEIHLDAEDAVRIHDRIRRDGAVFGVRPVGEQALALARLEAGHAEAGRDYLSAHDCLASGETPGRMSPLALGLERLLDFDTPSFTGRSALLKERKAGAERALVGLVLEGDAPMPDGAVMSGRQRAGHITACAWSPTAGRVVALAVIEASALGASTPLTVRDAHGHSRAARMTARPFFSQPRARRTPPNAC